MVLPDVSPGQPITCTWRSTSRVIDAAAATIDAIKTPFTIFCAIEVPFRRSFPGRTGWRLAPNELFAWLANLVEVRGHYLNLLRPDLVSSAQTASRPANSSWMDRSRARAREARVPYLGDCSPFSSRTRVTRPMLAARARAS